MSSNSEAMNDSSPPCICPFDSASCLVNLLSPSSFSARIKGHVVHPDLPRRYLREQGYDKGLAVCGYDETPIIVGDYIHHCVDELPYHGGMKVDLGFLYQKQS